LFGFGTVIASWYLSHLLCIFGEKIISSVLVLTVIELIFLPVPAVFWIYYEKNVDSTVMVLVVAEKLRTFYSFPSSTDEQVCRSWEGAQPVR